MKGVAGVVLTFRPMRGDRVRVGKKSVFVDAPAIDLGLEVGTVLWMEVPLPSGVTIRPLVEVTGMDDDWFAADYVHMEQAHHDAIEAYYLSRPSQSELLVRAVRASAEPIAALRLAAPDTPEYAYAYAPTTAT